MYNEKDDEYRVINVLIFCDENFINFYVYIIGEFNLIYGFFLFKFIFGIDDNLFVVLKIEEDKGIIRLYIVVYDIYGRMFMDEILIGNNKFEGIEFI